MKDIKSEVGMRIRYFRLRNGWTIEELSFHAQMHPNYLGDVERGKRNLSLENLAKIASALNLPISDIFPAQPKAAQPLDRTWKLVYKLAALLKHLSPRDQEFVLRTARFLATRRTKH